MRAKHQAVTKQTRPLTPEEQRKSSTLHRLTIRLGAKKARELVSLGQSIEQVAQSNARRSDEDRRSDYENAEFVEI